MIRIKDHQGRPIERWRVEVALLRLNSFIKKPVDGIGISPFYARLLAEGETLKQMQIAETAAVERVREIALHLSVIAIKTDEISVTSEDDGDAKKEASRKMTRVVEKTNDFLKRYPVHRQISADLTFGRVYSSFEPHTRELRKGGLESNEIDAVIAAVDLASWGILQQLPECEVCAQFYLPSRADQHTCGTRCSKKRDEAKPERKAQRREAQKERYERTFAPAPRESKKSKHLVN